ncbi:hypothetical protein DMC30DRAFT_447750 [Rhodotorula diobovata]|uniref:Zn(2)-C6 fungal-type domain-containing protein n=1 Tax=Rhodotorula diobovata TaxID=5288 RepID=A0A5C5FRX3_9BASI|nr:hypothetical protein DMC30DRAFT_447750 [Rhodotorula diobovata]
MQPYPGYPYPHAAPPGYAYPYPVQSTSHHPAPPPPHSLSEVNNDDPAPRKRARVSSAGPGSAKGGKGGTKGRKGAAAGPDSEGDDDDAGRKRRIPLSCTECVRRKIKCDRVMPCSSCVRRKRVEFCTFEDEDPSTPYAPTSEVRALARRLAHLESLFQLAHPNLKTTSSAATFHASPASHQSLASPSVHHSPGHALSHSQQTSPAHGQPPVAGSQADAARPRNDDRNGEDDSPASHSDTEDAVADLEEQTFGARVPVLRALHAAAQGPVATYKYVKVPDMEHTSCLTSILAEPLSFDQDGRPRSAVRLGLDLAVSTVDLPAVRHDALAQIFAVLPDPEIASYLLTKYFQEMEWDFRVLDPVAFPIEHERYVQMLATGREDLIDPLWIACFCMVLALSLEGFFSRPTGRHDLSLFRGLSETDLKDLPSVWHDAALRALQLGEWGGTPRIRTVQCCVLFAQYIQISSSSGQQGRFLGWAASAFRVAQRMGLHRLGSDPQTMPPDDPALPPGCNAVKRQSAVRLWHHLVNIDSWLSDSPSLRCYMLHPSQYNTARPLNLNLRDLSRTDWRHPAPQPLTTYTDASFQLAQCKVAEQIRHALDTLVLSGNAFSYPAVLEQDKAWRDVLEDVPDVFREGQVAVPTPRIAYERACLHEDVYSRIVRLNRPLLGRGYALNSPFRYSTEQCIEAAKALILNNAEMLTIETSRWWTYTGTLASSIVLSMDLFHAIDHDRPEKEMKEKRDILYKARAIFDTKTSTPALEVVVEEGRKILAALLVAEENRRTTRAAHDMAAAPPPSLEPFSQVLKRISREVAASTEDAKPATHLSQPTPLGGSYTVAPSPFPSSSARTAFSSSAPSPHPPFSFAQAAATAMANTPMSLDPVAPPGAGSVFEPASGAAAGGGGGGGGGAGDFSSFFNTLESEDWTAATSFTSPGGDEASLLDQLAATW